MRVRSLFAVTLAFSFVVYLGCDDGNNSGASGVILDAGTSTTLDATPGTTSDAAVTESGTGADAGPDGAAGCADGTREGLVARGVAGCGGTWTDDVANAASLCSAGWHICDGSEAELTALTYDEAADASVTPGCYALNAAQDNYTCHVGCGKSVEAGVDGVDSIDMGAIGGNCPSSYYFPNVGGCITGGRIDFSENSGTGCRFAAGLTGVACCKN